METLESFNVSTIMTVDCVGTETSLTSCLSTHSVTTNCEYLLVDCTTPTDTPEDEESGGGSGASIALVAGLCAMSTVIFALVLIVILLIMLLLKKNKK